MVGDKSVMIEVGEESEDGSIVVTATLDDVSKDHFCSLGIRFCLYSAALGKNPEEILADLEEWMHEV